MALLTWALEADLGAEVAFQRRPVVRRPGSGDFQIISGEGRNVIACVLDTGTFIKKTAAMKSLPLLPAEMGCHQRVWGVGGRCVWTCIHKPKYGRGIISQNRAEED